MGVISLEAEERFPYEESQWGGDLDERKRWFDALERTGPERVRARLAEMNPGSRAIVSFSDVDGMTAGFAEEWLAWHDRKKAERETTFRTNQIFWTRWAAMAATVAALAAAVGWLITISTRH